MKAIVFNVESGEIKQSLDFNNLDEIHHLKTAFEDVIPIEGAWENHYVSSGVLLEFPARPSSYHEWDWTTKSWLPNLDAAREAQRQAWNAWRDRELNAGYVHEGHRFHTNDGFMGELHLLLKGHEEGLLTGTSSIRTMGNVVLQKTGAEIKTLLLILGIHRQAIYQQSWVGKDALAGLTTLEDIVAGGPPS